MKVLRTGFKFPLIFLLAILMWITVNCFDADLDRGPKQHVYVEEVEETDNGYQYLSFLNDNDYSLISDESIREKLLNIVEGKEWDSKFIEKLLEDKKEALSALELAILKPKFQPPISEDPLEMLPFTGIIDLNRLVLSASVLNSKNGDFINAIEYLNKSILFSQSIKNTPDTNLISYFISSRMEHEAISVIHRLVNMKGIDSKVLAKISLVLQSIPDYRQSSFSDVFYGEFRFGYKLAALPFTRSLKERLAEYHITKGADVYDSEFNARGKNTTEKTYELLQAMIPWYFIHPNETANALFSKYDTYAKEAHKYCNEVNVSSIDEQFVPDFWDLISPNSLGKGWESTDTNLKGYYIRNCHAHMYIESVRAIIAIKRFEALNRRLPDSLQELVPGFLDTVPVDPFDGSSLRYSKENRWVYSVGINFRDDGGSSQGEYNFYCGHNDVCSTNQTVFFMLSTKY